MFRFNHDFSSRFRILKGGKVSLVVSAMLLGAVSANAYNITISDSPTTCAGAIGGVITAVADCNILASEVTSALGSGNLEINVGATDGNITLQSDISWSANTLTLTATNGNFLVGFTEGGAFAGKATISGAGAISINGDSYTVITDRTALETVATGGKYVLGNMIDLSVGNWTPLSGFYGVFDGLGNTVTNMTIDGSSGNFLGLFAGTGTYPNGAHFRNVGVLDVNITNGGNQVGALAGNLDYGGSVKNSYSTGTISAGQSIGGLVGNIYSATPSASIINSFSTASITGNSSVGGLIGTNNGTISNSYARGSVTATVASGDPKAGGFVGSNNNGTISNSYSTGLVTKASGSTSVGGFVGDNLGGTITNSFWDTTTSGTTVKIGSTQGTSLTLVGKTTADMKKVTTYTATTPSWNITGIDGEYPTLTMGGATTWIIYGNNVAPTLTTVSNLRGILEGFTQEITFADLQSVANETDSDGTVEAFVVKAVSSGTLKIGTNPFHATNNNTIDASHKAYWTPSSSGDGVDAFTIVAKDNGGAESATPVQVVVDGIASTTVTGTITSGYDFTDSDSSSYPKANLLLSDGSSINVTTGSAIKAEYLDIGVSVNGSIIADDFTIEIASTSGMPNNIINYGNITASGTNATAIKTNSGTSIITNGGTITGNVILADGEDDTFNVLAGSVVNGYVDAGTSANRDPVAQYLVLNSSSDTLGTNQVLSTEVGTLASAPWNFDLSTVGVDKTYRNFESVYTNDSNITFVGSGDINAILDLYEGGTIKVGDTNTTSATGLLQVKGLSLDPSNGTVGTGSSKIIFDLKGITAGTEYDQVEVNGTVDISNTDLNITLLNGFSADVNSTFVLIKNDGTDAVTGIFNNLIEGADINISNNIFEISYSGGDGNNDVVLKLLSLAQPTVFEISIVDGAVTNSVVATADEPFTHIPTKEGYTFAGWYTDASFETTFDPRAPITANTTLYPKWVANSNNSVTMSINTMAHGVREVTIQTADGLNIANASNIPNPTGLGKGMKLPFGSFAFDISGGTTGFTAPMSIVVDKDVGSFTYYKQNNVGKWVNLTKKITFLPDDKVQIDFDLTDGGVFDRDGSANGTIVDLGGVATNALNPYVIEGTTLVGDASFVEDPSLFVGTVSYTITGGANSTLFEIDSATGELSFKNAPVYNTTASNNYFVEVTASGSTSGKEIRAIMVTVLNADGDNEISPVGVAESCGTSARKNLLVAPIAGLCQSGIASTVSEVNDIFTWNCNTGQENSTVVSCSAKKVSESVITNNSTITGQQTNVIGGVLTTVTTGTNSIEATKFTTGEAKTEHIAKANGAELSKATSFVEGTQITVKPTGDVETSVDMISGTNTTVSIKVEGKVSGDDKAIHTLNINGKETKASSKITGTTTQIKVDGEVETVATVSGNEAKAIALPDGTATHTITVGTVESKAIIEISGAQTVIDNRGITTSVDENQTIGGNAITVKSIVKTDTLGESQTWFEDSNGVQLERTVSAHTPLESGATVNVSKDATSGKLQFKIKTKVTRDLTIE